MTSVEPTNGPTYMGTSPPISYSLPTVSEFAIDAEMFRYLQGCGTVFETVEGDISRSDAVHILEIIVSSWVTSVGLKKNMPAETVTNGGGVQLRVYGSQRLGVHSTTADIDMLCLAPCYVTREDYFTSFVDVLQQFSTGSRKRGGPTGASVAAGYEDICTQLRALQMKVGEAPVADLESELEGCVAVISPIRDAYTPVIKFSLHNISIDMIFASLPGFFRVPSQLNIMDNRCLGGLDDKSVRSLNGSRVTERILQLVPSAPVFCVALRAIKHWARQRGIYSNILGFLGGVNYAIMVAFVCQRYVNACPSVIVRNFFRVFCQWRWPNPVMLTGLECESVLTGESAGALGLPSGLNADTAVPVLEGGAGADGLTRMMASAPAAVWNPQLNHRDVAHLMPIITPCYPAMNSTYNVGAPQFRLLQHELQRAHNMFVQTEVVLAPNQPPVAIVGEQGAASPMRKAAADVSSISWGVLCAPATLEFFARHCRYVQIDICATSELQQRIWFGWCESRLRQLVNSLEQPPFMFCHPFGNCFNRQTVVRGSKGGTDTGGEEGGDILYTSSFFVGLSFRAGLRRVDVSPSIIDFREKVLQWADRCPGMNLAISLIGRSAIPGYVYEMVAEPSSQSGCTPAKSKPFSTTPTKARSPSAQARKLFTHQAPTPVPSNQSPSPYPPALPSAGIQQEVVGGASVHGGEGRESPEFSIYFAIDDGPRTSPPRTSEKATKHELASTPVPTHKSDSKIANGASTESVDFVELLVSNSKGKPSQEPGSGRKKKR
mgnify:FL=1